MRRQVRRFVERRMPAVAEVLERLLAERNAARYTVYRGEVLPDRIRAFRSIPGMLPLDHCIRLYFLAYGNAPLGGDIIEIGSWQGRSTCFLAQACKDAGVGVVHAIDHFRGNPGKESHYVVGSSDLSDLEANCRANIARVGLADFVRLHAADAGGVSERVGAATHDVRLLFIDGEHSAEAVRRDIAQYVPLLKSGGLIVFDDYAPEFSDYVAAVDEAVADSGAFTAVIRYERTLIARKR